VRLSTDADVSERLHDGGMVPGSIDARVERRVREEVLGRLADGRNVRDAQRRLFEHGGGYEIVHTSPGLEIGVYVLVAPEPDHQEAHPDDEVYVVLEGEGALTVEGHEDRVRAGDVMFVPAGMRHGLVATGADGDALRFVVVTSPPNDVPR
jgi:mannose-6-phosphate isomerase-like protein (cupin superfamily)